MAKVIALFFAFMILSQSASAYFGTLQDFNVLIEHAKVHSEEYGDNFFVFLSKHYGDMKDHHSHDEPERENQHEDLPFNHNGASHPPITLNKSILAFSLIWTELPTDKKSIFSYQNLYSSPYTSGILQPPQNA